MIVVDTYLIHKHCTGSEESPNPQACRGDDRLRAYDAPAEVDVEGYGGGSSPSSPCRPFDASNAYTEDAPGTNLV